MKTGDKVWLFMPTTQEITYAKMESETRVQKSRFVSVKFRCGVTLSGLKPGFDVFPTREALCEHYKKIFE
jgi:hypothetical protein